MLSGSSQQSLTKNEVNLVIKFKNFIKKYIGVTGESWAFNPALKRVYRVARWMGKHQELSVSTQVEKLMHWKLKNLVSNNKSLILPKSCSSSHKANVATFLMLVHCF
jgi:hypothetical protein